MFNRKDGEFSVIHNTDNLNQVVSAAEGSVLFSRDKIIEPGFVINYDRVNLPN